MEHDCKSVDYDLQRHVQAKKFCKGVISMEKEHWQCCSVFKYHITCGPFLTLLYIGSLVVQVEHGGAFLCFFYSSEREVTEAGKKNLNFKDESKETKQTHIQKRLW